MYSSESNTQLILVNRQPVKKEAKVHKFGQQKNQWQIDQHKILVKFEAVECWARKIKEKIAHKWKQSPKAH